MLLANYQFANWLGATFRYTHEDYEAMSVSHDADRLTFALLLEIKASGLMLSIAPLV